VTGEPASRGARSIARRVLPALPALEGRVMDVEVPASLYGPAARVRWVMTPEEQLRLAAGDEVLREVETVDEETGAMRQVYICLNNVPDPEGFVSLEGYKLVTVVQYVPFATDRLAELGPGAFSDVESVLPVTGTEITDT
jgi:hypothetical protein